MDENKDLEKLDIHFSFDNQSEIIHPAELADVLDELSQEDGAKAFLNLSEEIQVKVFSYLSVPLQHTFILELSVESTAYILNNLESDDRTRFFANIPLGERAKYFALLNEKDRKTTQDFLGYPSNSVARIVDTNYATIFKHMSVGEASAYVRKNFNDTEAINVIYVIDKEGKLLDDIQVRRLVLNPPEVMIEDLMDGNFVALHISDSKEAAVEMFMDYDRVVIPVVNDENYLLGVVTVDDIMDVAERRETKDIHKIGGVEELDFPDRKSVV